MGLIMRKFLFFAAACVALVACNNKDNALNGEQPDQPKKKVTISATINLGDEAKSAIRMIQPNASDLTSLTDGKTINFHWEEGDSVTLTQGNVSKVFKLVKGSISADGKSAKFEGEPFDDMSSYIVRYKNCPVTRKQWSNDYTFDGINPPSVPIHTEGQGNDDGFTLDTYNSLLRLQLIGTDKLSKIKWENGYSWTGEYNFTTSVELSSTVTVVYIPCVALIGSYFQTSHYVIFYDDNGSEIMYKSFTMPNATPYTNCIINLPELEVKK